MTSVIAWGQYVFHSRVFQPPGNSLRTVDVAFGYGFDGVELDVKLSKDNQLVLMHDDALDRTTKATGSVRAHTADELSRIELRDPWAGVPCYVERLSLALQRIPDQGLAMIDTHNVSPATARGVVRAVEEANIDPAALILLSYTSKGGALYKQALPTSSVLLKAPHHVRPPDLGLALVEAAAPLDGVLAPIVGDEQALATFQKATQAKGLKLGVYMHKPGRQRAESERDLSRLFEAGVDYVTSYAPMDLGPVFRKHRVPRSYKR